MTEKDQAKMIEDLKRRAREQNERDGYIGESILSSHEHLNEGDLFAEEEKSVQEQSAEGGEDNL